MNVNAAKYDMRHNPAYQIDCQILSSGRRLCGSKRRVRFKFGFSRPDALAKGLKGSDCRGEEHEINFVWSVTSGKRSITADGEEVHHSKGSFIDSKFETSWTMKGEHILKLVAHLSHPRSKTPGVIFRQYDLFLDGCSYFRLPRIFELGVVDAVRKISAGSAPGVVLSNVDIDPAESSERRQPVERTSKRPMDNHLLQEVRTEEDYPGTWSSNGLQNQRSNSRANTSIHCFSNPIPCSRTFDESTPFQVQIPRCQVRTNGEIPHTQLRDRLPVANTIQRTIENDQLAASRQLVIWPHNLGPYGAHGDSTSPQAAPIFNHIVVQPSSVSPMSLSMMTDLQEQTNRWFYKHQLSYAERALHSLVNLDDIKEVKVSPEQAKADEKKKAVSPFQSKPLPPRVSTQCAQSASLMELKRYSQPIPPPQIIRQTNAFNPAARQAGILIRYGAS